MDKLPDNYKEIIFNKELVDNDIVDIVKKTYKEVLKKGETETVMYNPPIPKHSVKNGSIVFEFVYGKNSKKLNEDEYVDNMKKQREFIVKINNMLIKEIEEIMEVPCSIFVEKRM